MRAPMAKPLTVAALAGFGVAVVLRKYWGRWKTTEKSIEEERSEEKERPRRKLEWTLETVAPYSEDAWAVRSSVDEEGRTFLLAKQRHESTPYVLLEEKDGFVKSTAFESFEDVRPRPPREPMSKISTVVEFNSFLSKVEAS